MRHGISSHVFLPQRLRTSTLDAMLRSGATVIEIFAARHHFDYADRAAVREIGRWFRDSGATPTLHQPLYPDSHWSRHVAPTFNLIDPEKSRRIDAMDETKRALESAEQIHFRSIVLHLGMNGELWGTRALENALTAIEHLKAFATPLGVQLLLENLPNEIATPEHLLEILRIGHFDSVGICFDVGHAHLTDWKNPGVGIDAAFELLKPLIAELHLHDNNGSRDEHLWPATTTTAQVPPSIDWTRVYRHTSSLAPDIPGILEIAHTLNETVDSAQSKASAFFDSQLRLSERPLPEEEEAEAS